MDGRLTPIHICCSADEMMRLVDLNGRTNAKEFLGHAPNTVTILTEGVNRGDHWQVAVRLVPCATAFVIDGRRYQYMDAVDFSFVDELPKLGADDTRLDCWAEQDTAMES